MRQEKFDFTINDIITNAQQLFLKYGYKKTSIEDIAEATNRAKSTIYHFFSSKEQIFDAVVTSEMQDLRKTVTENVDKVDGAGNKVLAYLDSLVEGLSSKLTLMSIITDEIKDKTVGKNEYNKVVESENAYLTQLLQNGFDSGEFKNVNREDLPLLAEVVLSGFFGIVGFLIKTDSRYDVKKISRLLKTIGGQII